MSEMSDFWAGVHVIYSYTRAEAIADGVLVDVSRQARSTGFKIPVAITAAAYEDCCRWDESTEAGKPEFTAQDTAGRTHDVLWMAFLAAARMRNTDRVTFEVFRVPPTGRGWVPRKVSLIAVVGPGDNAEPVLTIGFPSDF